LHYVMQNNGARDLVLPPPPALTPGGVGQAPSACDKINIP